MLSESAVETLDRNSPRGLLESPFEGASFSTAAKSVLAVAVSPDLIAAIKLFRALSNEFPLLLVVLVVDEVEDEASSVKRLLLLCNAEMDMKAILCL